MRRPYAVTDETLGHLPRMKLCQECEDWYSPHKEDECPECGESHLCPDCLEVHMLTCTGD